LGVSNRLVTDLSGGRRGKERTAKRSSDWRRGAAGSPDPDFVLTGAADSPDPDYVKSGATLLLLGWL